MNELDYDVGLMPIEEFCALDSWYWDSSADKYYNTNYIIVDEATKRNIRRKNENILKNLEDGDICTFYVNIERHNSRPCIILKIPGWNPLLCILCSSEHRGSDWKEFPANIEVDEPLEWGQLTSPSHVATNRYRYLNDKNITFKKVIGHAKAKNLADIKKKFIEINKAPGKKYKSSSESTDLEYAKQLSKKAEKGLLSPFVNYINPDSIDEPDNKENILEVVHMDLFMESELFDLDALDAAVEAGGPPELPKSNREEAIELFTKAYFGKYPVKYFPNNTDKKHDRIIGEITIPEAETATGEKFLGEVIKKLNDKQSKFTFSYRDKYIFADIDMPDKTEKKTEAKPASEAMVLESTAGVMDFNNLYPINEFKDMALVKRYVNDFGLTLEQAVNTMEYFCLANPFLVLDAIDEDMYTSPEAYDNALLEAFCNAVKITGHQVDAYMENAASIDIYCEEATGKKDFKDKPFFRKLMNQSKPLNSKELAECDREVEAALRKAKCPDVKYERTHPIIRELGGYSCGVLTLKVGGDKEDVLKVIRQLNKDTKKYKYRAQRFTSSYLPVTDHFNIGWSYIVWVVDKKDPVDHIGSGLNKPFTMENTIVDEAVKHPDGVDHTIQAGKDALKSGIKNVKNFVSKDPHTGRTGAEKMAHDAKKHVLSPLVSGIAKAYDELIGDSAEREEVIAGGLKGKLLKARRLFLKVILAYKTPVLLSALVASGFGTPAAILIKIVGWIAGFAMATHTGIADSSANETKNTVIAELELELKIVREKIEDAKSAGDTKAKYELMRTENKIEMEIYRIKFGKYPRKSSKF